MGRLSRVTRLSVSFPCVVIVLSGCSSASVSAPTLNLGDEFDSYNQLGPHMSSVWSAGFLLQPSVFDGSSVMVSTALGPSYTFGAGFVHDRSTTRRTFGLADGLRPNSSYDVTIAHRVRAAHAGSYPQDSRSVSGLSVNGVTALVQFDGSINTGQMAWRVLSVLGTSDANGNLTVEFGILQNSGFFTYVDFDHLMIR
jgi:hypothetical protein